MGGHVMRRLLPLLIIGVAACGLVGVGASCGSTQAQPDEGRDPANAVLDMGNLSLTAGSPFQVAFHTDFKNLRIFVIAKRPLLREKLYKIDYGAAQPKVTEVRLSGSGHTNGGVTVYALIPTEATKPGWYRLVLDGQGLVESLAVGVH